MEALQPIDVEVPSEDEDGSPKRARLALSPGEQPAWASRMEHLLVSQLSMSDRVAKLEAGQERVDMLQEQVQKLERSKKSERSRKELRALRSMLSPLLLTEGAMRRHHPLVRLSLPTTRISVTSS